MLKRVFTGILLLTLLILPIEGFGDTTTNSMIKVGMYYGSTSKIGFNIGSKPLEIYEKNSKIANVNNSGKYRVSLISKIYTTGEYFNSFGEASNRSAKLQPSFVYYDGTHYFVATTTSKVNVSNQLTDTKGVLISCDGNPSFGYTLEREIYISNAGNMIEIEGKAYRGKLLVKADSNKLSAINYVDIEEYLKGVVGSEMSGSWASEALKAQAVVARSYTMFSKGRYANLGFDICANPSCQVYGGMSSESASVNSAVDNTRGQMMYYGKDLVEGVYCSSSGGKTEDNENVWGGVAVPYLRGVDDPYSVGSPNDNWTVELTPNQIKSALGNRGVDVGEILNIKVTKVSAKGRATELTVTGTKGTKIFLRDSVRSSISAESLKSTLFTIVKIGADGSVLSKDLPKLNLPTNLNVELKQTYNNLNQVLPQQYGLSKSAGERYIIKGSGWGHGVGLSQYGAKKMAEKGMNYKQILEHYFTGIDIR